MQVLGAICSFAAGFAAGMGLVLAGYLAWTTWLGGLDREGAVGMAVFFLYGPAAGLLLGICASALFWWFVGSPGGKQ